MEQLAIFGGTPVREQPLGYGKQWIEEDDIQAVAEVLRNGDLTCGPMIAAAEQKLCEVTGASYAVAVSNGTAALHLAAMAAGFGEGDEVIVSPITFAASANCVLYCGARPVFADIDPETYNIDPAAIEKLVTPRTRGIVAVDYTGQAVRHREIGEICRRHGLGFIEDAAHAIGTRYCGQPVGSLADMTCFSFHPVKTVTSGEGGAVTTNDEGVYRRLRGPERPAYLHDILKDRRQIALCLLVLPKLHEPVNYLEMIQIVVALGPQRRIETLQIVEAVLQSVIRILHRQIQAADCHDITQKHQGNCHIKAQVNSVQPGNPDIDPYARPDQKLNAIYYD